MLHAISQVDLVIMLKLAKVVICNHISPSVFSYHTSTNVYTIYKLFSHLYKCKRFEVLLSIDVFTNTLVIRELRKEICSVYRSIN